MNSTSVWADATLAAALLAVDAAGMGGVAVRAGAGPVRDQWLALLKSMLDPAKPFRKLPGHIRDDRLLGGLDLAATLQAGQPVAQRGLLAESHGGLVLIAMAERLPSATAARVAAVMDQHEVVIERDGITQRHASRFGVIAFDESVNDGSANDQSADDEAVPRALMDRLAMHIDLSEVSTREAFDADAVLNNAAGDIAQARARLSQVSMPEAQLQALCAAAVAMGVASMRAPLMGLRAACAHAALSGRDEVTLDDTTVAARLVLAPRATLLPPAQATAPESESESEPPTETPPEPEAGAAETDVDGSAPEIPSGPIDDLVLQAALAALPAGLLARLKAEQAGRERARGAGKSGALQKAGTRGRPAGVRRGEPSGGQRLNLIETLRAAAPWQKLRRASRASHGDARGVIVHAEDFHITRYRQRRETTTIFVVDASGSSALNRLAEAKGAVELLLADCYIRRDRVAVIGFRGRSAELLLPPTRSLVRAKRSLAGLPGGGGTPLAAALEASAALADGLRRRGETPVVVLLTDGRANVALDGTGGRTRAEADALLAARHLRAAGCAVLLVDTSPQPHPQAASLAAEMRATYLPLPQAGAETLSQIVRGHAVGAAAVRR